MKLFENRKDFPYLRWVEGFCLGIVLAAGAAVAMPTKEPEVKIIKVPEIKVIEKEKIVNKPVYLSANDRKQIQCMAENTYFEAGHEPVKGRIAVNNVVLNRVEDKRFPKTPCGVINQRTARVCQFSWKCEGGKRIRDNAAFAKAKEIAEHVYIGNYGDVTRGAQFYHADYVSPSWGKVFDRTTKIGAHIFYKG
jgi:spore germination cell wall hydrolase CwlJ-like protein